MVTVAYDAEKIYFFNCFQNTWPPLRRAINCGSMDTEEKLYDFGKSLPWTYL